MICTRCHTGLPHEGYPEFGESWPTDAQMKFVAVHRPHNAKWARSWQIAISRRILIAYKYGDQKAKDEADALYKRYVEVFREDIRRDIKVG